MTRISVSLRRGKEHWKYSSHLIRRQLSEVNLKKPFVAKEIKQCDFFGWKGHLGQKYKPETKYLDGSQVRISDIPWMKFGWDGEVYREQGARLAHHLDEVSIRTGYSKLDKTATCSKRFRKTYLL